MAITAEQKAEIQRKKYLDQLYSRRGEAKQVDPAKKCEVSEAMSGEVTLKLEKFNDGNTDFKSLTQAAEFPETDNNAHMKQDGKSIKHGFAQDMSRLTQEQLKALEGAKKPKTLAHKVDGVAVNVLSLEEEDVVSPE